MSDPSDTQAARAWREEALALVRLALPLVAGNLAWAGIAAIDLLLLGRAGPDAVAAGALAINVYNALLIAGIGLVTAASPLIASERGRRRHSVRDIRRTVRQTIWSAILFCLPACFVLWHGETVLRWLHQDPELSAGAAALLRGLVPAMLPYLVFMVLRQFISALERPIWGVVVIVLALPVDAVAGYALIFGRLGMPKLGLLGAGIASSVTTGFMMLAIIAVILGDRQFRRYALLGRFWVADWARFRDVWRIGSPIAVTLALEVTVFNAAAFLIGLIDRVSLAAHAIAIQIAALSFMVPMGIAQAATIRVGYHFGSGNRRAVGQAGWAALVIGTVYAAIGAVLLIGFPRLFVGVFVDVSDPANTLVVRLAVSFLIVAAFFQLFDCTQVIGAGVLRGIQDTRVPMIFAAVGYWGIGIGVGALLAFHFGLKGVGVWLGLASGLGVVAVLMLVRWTRRDRIVTL